MKYPAPLRAQPVEQVLATSHKRDTKTILLKNSAEDAPSQLHGIALIRNAAVGMALIYLERLEAIWSPLVFSIKNLWTFTLALIHISLPLIAAWFATHWSERIESAMLGGSFMSSTLSFIAMWLLMLIVWSVIWLTLRSLGLYFMAAMGTLAQTGGSFLSDSNAAPSQARSSKTT
jgi:hypothetical protein